MLQKFWDWLYWGKGGSPYATFERRIMASMVDTLLLSIVIIPLVSPLLKAAEPARQQMRNYLYTYQQGMVAEDVFVDQVTRYLLEGGGAELLIKDTGYQALIIGVVVIIFWFCRSATPGKMLLNMEIVDSQTGGKPKPWQWFVRYVGYIFCVLPFMLGFVWILWDKRHQGWHDKMAGTLVILKRQK